MSTPDRGPLLLVLAGLVAFLAFYVLGRESSPVPPPSTPSIARTTEGAASAPPLDAANGRAITAKKGDRPEEKPPGSTPGSEAVAEASRKARAEAEGEVVAGGADGAYVDETGEGSGLDALFRHTLGGSPASPAGAGAPANAAEGGAVGPEEDAAPLPECEKPIISKSVFHLEFQPEMRSAFDAALQLARTG
ncbi:MAG: hypothetical protein Q8R92_19900, partial [Deltaproteobacteria bacterium]|nr:hypothetical protein [Deltaproteobacteria bacterium]